MDTELYNSHIKDARIGPHIIGKDIDAIVCINLDIRPEKRAAMIEEFKGYPFRFYTATLHEKPTRGCLESHINCIKWAKEQGLKNILILEDDVKIVKDLKQIPHFPDQWNLLYFGCLATQTHLWTWASPWIEGNFWCCHAYLVNNCVFDKFIEEGWSFSGPIDKFCVDKICDEMRKCYALQESSIIQKEGYSDIKGEGGKWKDFKWPKIGEQFYVP